MTLRDEIIAAIRASTWPTNDDQVEGIEEAADAVLALPAIAGALELARYHAAIGTNPLRSASEITAKTLGHSIKVRDESVSTQGEE
jgi:hypothetical protein